MKRSFKAAFVGAAAAVAVGMGTNPAQATPPVPTPEPGGLIRIDLAPGEFWSCVGYSLQAPFIQYSPGLYQYTQGPNPIYFRFAPGADVLFSCNGNSWPVVYYAPIVKAGQ